jgi:tetratricopeptide (TPR) repeat protein
MPRDPRPALAGAALVLLLNLLALTASLYARYAEQRLDRLPDARATRASAVAAGLAPWSAPARALQGWIHGASGDFEAADAAYAAALRRAPADALLWAEYALVLGRNRVFDARLEQATRRALALAPASPAVHQGLARMGLSYWRFAGPPVRELWRRSLRWELDRDRGSFLAALEREGYRGTFCAWHAEDLGEAAWCRREAR